MKRVRVGRYLSMGEVAALMKLPPATARIRAEKVRRLIRRLEKRDGANYLKLLGGQYYVAVGVLEQLLPWEPGTLHQLRSDVNDLAVQQAHQNKRLNDHAAQLRKQKRINGHVLAALQLNTES